MAKKASTSGGKGKKKGSKAPKKKQAPAKKARKKPLPKKTKPLTLDKLEKENVKLKEELRALKVASREQKKFIANLEKRMETRIKREEVLMKAMGVSSRTKKGERGVIEELNKSILKTEEYLLHMGKRIDNILAAMKNHREYLIKLNRKVYKIDAKKFMEIELEIINNTLSIMAMSGFDINKSIFSDTKKLKTMLGKKDVELSKVKKRMERLESKFDDEMERFDYESIFKKKDDIPGYR